MITQIISGLAVFLAMLCVFIFCNAFVLLSLFRTAEHEENGREQEIDEVMPPTYGALEDSITTFGGALYSSFNMMFTTLDPELMEKSFAPQLARMNYYYYSIMVALIMLNMSIAIMSETFQEVKDRWEDAGLRLRARLILIAERQMSAEDRANTELFPRFVCCYCLRQEELAAKDTDLDSKLDRIDSTIRELSGSVEKVNELDTRMCKIEDMLTTLTHVAQSGQQ